MTPDKQGYTPCPTCGVLAPVDRPHPATFCERALDAPLPPCCVTFLCAELAVPGSKYCEEHRHTQQASVVDIDEPHAIGLPQSARSKPPADWLKEVASGPPSPPLPEGLFHVGLPEAWREQATKEEDNNAPVVDVDALWGGA